ncbi:MAG: ribonuclease HII, partial [Pseudomonadota bacterium]|nr:ribonuclease HII [Pseudomonadota bacterium]
PEGLDDSKKLTAARRADMFARLTRGPHLFNLTHVDVATIDRIGILKATLAAMAEVAAALAAQMQQAGHDAVTEVLIDGNQMPPTDLPSRCVVRGDATSLSIAAASVIAKHSRDMVMTELDKTFPGYGWAQNMGYGTAQHRDAIDRLGITIHHRRSFAPIRRYLESEGKPVDRGDPVA